ncbi:MAG: hypothetical protein LBK06_07580 [Planctomycetaceae bacterium]|nr:hypothetical protein [Planctomycetaceae bacterium]
MIEKYGGIATEKQLFFAGIVENLDWGLDLDKGEISFGGSLVFPVQILGSFAHSPETWLWGWANSESDIPENLLEDVQKLKEYGDTHKIDFLTSPQFKITRDFMHYVGLIAIGMFGASGYYLGNYGDGTICLTISSKDIDEKFPNNHLSILTIFPNLILQYETNHKETFMNYLNQKGYEIEKNENEIVGKKGKDKIKATFDELNRLKELTNADIPKPVRQ